MASVPVPGAGVDEIWAMASNVIANSGKTGQYKRIEYTNKRHIYHIHMFYLLMFMSS